MADTLEVRIRGNDTQTYGSGSTTPWEANARGEGLVAQGVPSKTELASLGHTWNLSIATGSAFTHVAAMPTTLAELVLYNGEPGTGRHYVINSVWYVAISSIAAAANVTLLYQVGPAIAAPTDDTAQLIWSPSGASNYGGAAKRSVSDTTFTANKWAALAASPAGAAASIGLGIVAEVNGGIIIGPGASLGLNVVAGTAVGTAILGVNWSEVEM